MPSGRDRIFVTSEWRRLRWVLELELRSISDRRKLPVCESIFGTLVCLRADLKPLKRSHTNLTLTGCCFTRTLTPTVFFSTRAMTRHVRSSLPSLPKGADERTQPSWIEPPRFAQVGGCGVAWVRRQPAAVCSLRSDQGLSNARSARDSAGCLRWRHRHRSLSDEPFHSVSVHRSPSDPGAAGAGAQGRCRPVDTAAWARRRPAGIGPIDTEHPSDLAVGASRRLPHQIADGGTQ